MAGVNTEPNTVAISKLNKFVEFLHRLTELGSLSCAILQEERGCNIN
jgi:hypothetical protein